MVEEMKVDLILVEAEEDREWPARRSGRGEDLHRQAFYLAN